MRKGLEMKKMLVLFAAVILLMLGSVVSEAKTTSFNVTVNANVMNKDPFSYKEMKDDGEKNFYVRPTYFSAKGAIKVRSVYSSNYNQKSGWVYLYSDNLNVATVNPYNCTVYPGGSYYLQSDYGWGSSSEINVRGYYTP